MTVFKQRFHLLIFVLAGLLVALDQWTKYLAATRLPRGQSHSVIGNFLHLSYLENRGAAFGFFAGNSIILIGLTSVMIILLALFVLWKKPTSRLLCLSLSLILAGGVGNLIDRVQRGYVVDFFYLKFINFAVFNVADCFVVIGTGLLFYHVLQNERAEQQLQQQMEQAILMTQNHQAVANEQSASDTADEGSENTP